MKKRVILLSLIVAGLNIIAMTAMIKKNKTMKPKDIVPIAKTNRFALLELFTSEGCSSCPPADELIERIKNEYKDQPVYILGFHVDYWDRQGWKDVFSNHDYTIRQSEYADMFRLNSMYTPQLIVNGSAEMVGSDQLKVRNAITRSLSVEHTTELLISAKPADSLLTLDYDVFNAPEFSHILVAVTKKSALTRVERGENKGHILSHIQVVYSLRKEPLNSDGKGNISIRLPLGYNKTEWEVIVFIQSLKDGQVSAIERVM